MSIFLLLYFIISLLILLIWFKILCKYWKYIYGKYFFLLLLLLFLWLILYILVYTTIKDKDILLILSRVMYWIFLISMYSMLFFVIFFNNKNSKKLFKYNLIINIIFILFLFLVIFTKVIIKDMIFSKELQYHYEDFWILYFLYSILYLIFPFLFTIFSYFKIKKLNTINKIRLKYISFWFLIFILWEITFLGILPLFDIWIFQKEQILFFVPFIIWIWYSITRYNFMNIKIGLWKFTIFLLSLFLSLFIINILRYYYLSLWSAITESWGLSTQFWLIDLTIGIILFLFIHNFLNKMFLWNTKIIKFSKKIDKLKHQIPFINNLEELNNYLLKEFKHLFNIKFVKVNLLENKNTEELSKYFYKDKLNTIFINDIVFIEENKNKFNYNILENEIDKESYLIFPIYDNKNKLIWIFSLWTKPFRDHYYSEEIDILRNFSYFLEWHLKYISTYFKLENLNLSLDKKVDEKTIEYNNLINKQKEFISIVSHEVKWPIASSIFQWDCILDDIKDWNYDEKYLKKEIWILNEQLMKSWKLIDNLFDVQLYDVKEIKLYKEKINLADLLSWEIDMYKKINENIKFELNIWNNIWFVELDKIQFTQVIDNLLTNWVKFSKESKNKIIKVSCFIKNNYIFINIEDSWKWFKNIDITHIFDKYSTWNISWTGLWMWLFLCKRIVELHNWEINASVSKKIWWAKFTIRLNKN